MGALMRGIDYVTDRYGIIVARLVRVSVIGLVMVVGAFGGTWLLNKITPTGFLPEEDQGAFFVVVQLPDGASISCAFFNHRNFSSGALHSICSA